ncbi:hypothetical protein ABZ760_00425 [Streptomyces sp. NPDC006658]|uniref:hypothetical protein n=1 Tax=Streptomyces sp. NPDC006658 TaxID=3156900 RepID=UPI003405D267
MKIYARRLACLAISTGAAAVLLVGVSASAQANGRTAYAKHGAGKGYFKTHGDKFYIQDTKADGHSAVLQWKVAGRQGDDWDRNGANNGWTVANRDFPEGATVQYRACWGDWRSQYIQLSSCSQWVTTVNNS